jgi:cupin 2 domain-containing protein
MQIIKGNLFSDSPIDADLPESFEILVQTPQLLVERIITNPGFSAPGQWFDQDKDEWVILLQGNAELEMKDEEIIRLNAGDYLLIPSHKIHRIKSVSKQPSCIWLGIHALIK